MTKREKLAKAIKQEKDAEPVNEEKIIKTLNGLE